LLKKFIFGGTYGAAAVLLFVYRHAIMDWIDSDTVWHQDVLIALIALVIAVIPAIPYGVIAAVFGAKYGAVAGSAINLTISSLAAIILFSWIRYTFSEESRLKAARMRGVRRLTDYAERHAFFAILFARLLPVVPAQLINIYAAVTRMKWLPYIAATVLGKTPYLIAVTLLGDRAFQQSGFAELATISSLYAGFVLVVFAISRIVGNKRVRS